MGFNIIFDTINPYLSYGYRTLVQPIINRENLPYAMIGITSVILAYQFIEPDTDTNSSSSNSSPDVSSMVSNLIPGTSEEEPKPEEPKLEEPKLGGSKRTTKKKKRIQK